MSAPDPVHVARIRALAKGLREARAERDEALARIKELRMWAERWGLPNSLQGNRVRKLLGMR